MDLWRKWLMFGVLTQLCACVRTQQVTLKYQTFWNNVSRLPNIHVLDQSIVSGHTLQYLVTRDSITILVDYDFINSKPRTIYKQKIDDEPSDRLSRFLTRLRIDTLRDSYIGPAVCGHAQLVFVQDQFKNAKSIRLFNFSHPTIDTLVAEIRNLIKDEKLKVLR